jgi:class 3 adenylate cyclase
LAVASALFSRDSQRLVIGPLEVMARLVRNLAQDPLGHVTLNEDDESMDSETKVVAEAILKLSAMLQVGFGEAGATIIRANMANESPKIDPIVPGKRIMGIYGFCDIRNFTDCTECLQEDVMVFVNRCATFVHRAVKDNDGAPNKNIGDAFLCAWTLPEQRVGPNGQKIPLTIADGALKSILRIIIETAADPILTELTSRQAVQSRIPGYYTKFGFGLHVGWGIEGAIGSVLKIDATYLSPNVNMSARLEGATKTYGCVLLMTSDFYDILTPPVQKLLRRVDRVTALGSSVPFDLYTYDAVRFPDLETMQRGESFWERFPPTTASEFRDKFNEGVKHYIQGNWPKARELLEQCHRDVEDDGPTNFLLKFMGECDFVAPPKWNGYRADGVE